MTFAVLVFVGMVVWSIISLNAEVAYRHDAEKDRGDP